jgi:hypothetical protein
MSEARRGSNNASDVAVVVGGDISEGDWTVDEDPEAMTGVDDVKLCPLDRAAASAVERGISLISCTE